jgi:hypothetical protein
MQRTVPEVARNGEPDLGSGAGGRPATEEVE